MLKNESKRAGRKAFLGIVILLAGIVVLENLNLWLPSVPSILLFKDGKAADMRTAQTVIPAGAAQGKITCEMDIPDEPSAKFVLKCFLWDSAEKGISYAPYITLGGR